MTPEWRVEFDAEVVFSNGGALQTQGFRLDVPDADISDAQLAELLIRHLGLLMVGAVTFTRKTLIQEPHKGSRGVESTPGARRVIDLGDATLNTTLDTTPDTGLADLVDLPGVVVRVLGGSSVINRAALAPFEVKGHAVVLHGGGLTSDAADWLTEQEAALVATGAGARPTGIPVITGLTGLDSLPPNNFRLHVVPSGTSCRVYAIAL